MPRTIEEGFRDFLTRLTPSNTETEAAKRHRGSIQKTLKNNFGLLRFFRSGSFGNGTSIRGYSDVDYFAVIPMEMLHEKSKTSLRKIRDQLNTTFHSTNVRVDDPAIVCPFGANKKETTEIIPCDKVDAYQGYPVYDISDTNDSWMRACPDIHNAYIKQVDARLSGKLRHLIRFVKAWKYYSNAKISSFYLELSIAELMKNEQSIVYSIDMQTIVSWFYDNDLPAVKDPMGISGYIYPCKTVLQKKDALSKLYTAKRRIERARYCEKKNEIKKAFDWWSLVFAKRFPMYYKI